MTPKEYTAKVCDPSTKVYGPYVHSNNREHVVLKFTDRVTKFSMSYPKYLMHKAGYVFNKTDTVDHIDGNHFNNALTNLRIISRSENAKRSKHCNIAYGVLVRCVWCGIPRYATPSQINGKATKYKSGPFCGNMCAVHYHKACRLGLAPTPLRNMHYIKKEDRRYINSWEYSKQCIM